MEERQTQIMARIEQAEKWRDANYGALWQDCYRRYRSQPLPRNEGDVYKRQILPFVFSLTDFLASASRFE